jgi:hypothetical protein
MEQANGNCCDLVRFEDGDECPYRVVCEWLDDLPVVGRPFGDDKAQMVRHKRIRSGLVQVIQGWSIAATNGEHIGKPLCGNQGGDGTTPFEECIGGHGRPVDEDVRGTLDGQFGEEGFRRVGWSAQPFCDA